MFRWRGNISQGISMLVVGLSLGLLFSLVWSAPSARSVESGSGPGSVSLSVERLEAEQRELRASLAILREELAQRRQTAAANTDRLQALKSELDRQALLAGLVPVAGPGVSIVLDDSAAQISPGADPNAYIIHEHDLRDIVNLLWMAGSEAIAINDERLVGTSSIYCVGSTVMVNNTRLSPPYTIRAIGNPRVQQDYLRNPSYLRNLKEKQRLYSLYFQVRSASSVELPAYSGSVRVRLARPGE
ncbi:MAG: DUF881 domain-containing protein [Anaerolineae bacterium]|nr:DUF881 domain-containing protein [Anaerolineae bacterium]